MGYTTLLTQLGKQDILTAGGKGANLGELIAADLPVPLGFVLTTGAYDAFLQANRLQVQILKQVATVSAENPHSARAAAQTITALFMAGTLSADLAAEITAAYAQLTATGVDAVAVRSSATAEDLPTASFAGQQETYLNIQGATALLEAVKKCWASLWTARAIAYRQRQGIDPASVSLAVVVQQLVRADAAGVLFTANPINGARDQMVINATWGLGEAIVGGLVTPDTVVVDQSAAQIVTRETATKKVMTVRTARGTHEQPVPPAQQTQPVLDDSTALQLAQFGAQIATHYGIPMDIEWAIADGAISILQARPITSLPAEPLKDVVWEPIVPKTMWLRRQIVEHMPEPLSPLFEDLYLKQGMDETLTQLMATMGSVAGVSFDIMTMIPHGFAGTINGYAYTSGSIKPNARGILSILQVYARLFRLLKLPAFDWDATVLPAYQAQIADWAAIDTNSADNKTLLRGIRELAAADSNYWFASAVNLGLSRLMDSMFDRLLRSILFRFSLPNPRPGSSAFLRGFDSKALDAQAEMEALADMIRDSAELRQLALTTPANRLIETLAVQPTAQAIVGGIERYLDTYGHQIYNLDFVAPTQNEDPLPMLLSLKALVEKPSKQPVRVRQAKMAADRDALVEQVMRSLNPVSRRLFRWLWKWTKYYAPYREHVMFYMGAAWPTLRNLAATLGQRLTDAGAIAQPDDIYYLDSTEIVAAIEAAAVGQPPPNLAQSAQTRHDLRESRKLLTPLPKVPQGSSLKFGPIDLSMFDPTPADAGSTGPVLSGYAVSTGRITAPASVIHSIEDFSQMKPDTILVCTTTTPAWTPLFSQAVGLVTDVGGALAHGSIVAREYGIPAVMGTGVATERIQSGMMLSIDGDAGTVTLLDEVGAEAT